MMDMIAFRTAEQQVRNYHDALPGVMADHVQAMECRDCEDYLQRGIDAYRWLTKADEVISAAIYSGETEYDKDVDDTIAQLYRLWLGPCNQANEWARRQQNRGFKVENVCEFVECCREAEAIVRHLDGNQEINEAIVALRDAAVVEHREGKTVEFRWRAELSDC